jgi:hypothetical protein
MAAVTDVLIFFVGLTMWSDQLPNDCGVKAILPRVVHDMPNTGRDTPHVQNHMAAIVFPADSYDSQTGWAEPATLMSGTGAPTPPGQVFKYLVLDCDTVRFVTDAADNSPANLSGLTLPRLQRDLCPARQTLNAGYQLPYGEAAAVVYVPAGALRTCLSVPEDSEGRLETRLQLKTAGNLVISAGTMREPNKQLRLKPPPDGGPLQVMIANMPAPYYLGNHAKPRTGAIDGMSHEKVYYAMSGPTGSTCAMGLRDWWNQLQDPDEIFLCSATTVTGTATVPPIISTTLSTSGANFECSNTRWP